jgi:hypothetical protein
VRNLLFCLMISAAMGACGRTSPAPRADDAPPDARDPDAPWWHGVWAYDAEALAAEPDFQALPPDAQDVARELVEASVHDYRLTLAAGHVVRERDAQRKDASFRVEADEAGRVSLRLDDGGLLVLERAGPDRARVPPGSTEPAVPLKRQGNP